MKMKKFFKKNKYNDFTRDETKEEILVNVDTLRLLMNEFTNNLKQSRDWIATFSIALSMIVTFFVSDFKKFFIFTSEQVSAFFMILTLLLVVFTVYQIIKCMIVSSKAKVDYIVQQFRDKSFMPIEYRVLFIIKTNYFENANYLLFFNDETWDCFFLPNAKTKPNIITADLAEKISHFLGVEASSVSLNLFDSEFDMVSKKNSQFHKCMTLYYTKFCYVSITKPPARFFNKNFTYYGREFKWMTIPEVLNDPKEKEKNSDIIRHLEDFEIDLIIKPKDSVNFSSNAKKTSNKR
jgi:hypothetical protein